MVSPILVIVFSLFFAFVIPLLGMVSEKLPRLVPPIAIFINLLILLTNTQYVVNGAMLITTAGFKPPISINLAIDKFGLLFAILIQTIGFLLAIYYLAQRVKDQRFYMLFLLNIIGASGIVMTGDLFNSFVFLEILEISSFGLVALGKGKRSLEGGFKYMVIGAIGSSLYLLGIIILYMATGSLNMAEIAKSMPHISESVKIFAAILILIGIGVETELFPLNAWAPDAYTGAPDTISTQLASIISKASIYLAVRIFVTVFSGIYILKVVFYIGIITFIVSELAALRQKNVKRMLAYSSIGQMGLLMFTLSLLIKRQDIFIITAVILLAINHAFGKSLLFLSLGHLKSNNEKYELDSLKGNAKANPVIGFLFVIGALSIIGMPLFLGFWAKISLLIAVMKTAPIYFIGLILFISLIETYYYGNVIVHLFKGEGQKSKITIIPAFVMILLALFVIVLGIWPHPVFQVAHRAAESIVNRTAYISSIIGGM